MNFVNPIHTLNHHRQLENCIIGGLWSCITDRVDTGKLYANKYNSRYSKAKHHSAIIGWRQKFVGEISNKWLHLLHSCTATFAADQPPYLWGTASLVATCLRQYIELWEQQNKEVHDPTTHSHLEKERLAKETRKLHSLWHKEKFQDTALFSKDISKTGRTSKQWNSKSTCKDKMNLYKLNAFLSNK